MAPPKPKVLKIKLGPLYSLDAVRQDDVFLLVFSERGVVHRRTLMQLTHSQAMRLAQFLADIEVGDAPPPARDPNALEDTDPGGMDSIPLPNLPNLPGVPPPPEKK
jgi:hypothetical protein